MAKTLTLELETAIGSVNIISDGDVKEPLPGPSAEDQQNVESPRARSPQADEEIIGVCKTLENATAKINGLHEEIISAHNADIARLSVQIAEKILMKEIQAGNYDIEKIVQQTLTTVPNPQEITIRLNPDDLQKYQKAADDNSIGSFENTKMIGDTNIGPAQCIIETDKGMVQYFIDEHLKQIDDALRNTE